MSEDGGTDVGWQRLDKWLWCARFMRHRADCARLAQTGSLRINRQPTDKPHARLRVGDVLTVPLPRAVLVVEVIALAGRRGPPAAARALYRELPESGANGSSGRGGCDAGTDTAYPHPAPLAGSQPGDCPIATTQE